MYMNVYYKLVILMKFVLYDDHFHLTNFGKDTTVFSCIMLLHHLNIVQENMLLPSNSIYFLDLCWNPEASMLNNMCLCSVLTLKHGWRT